MFVLKVLGPFVRFVKKDIKNPNESKKMAVLIRFLSLVLILFFTINAIGFAIHGTPEAIGGNVALAILYLSVFGLSYRLPKMGTVWAFIIVTTVWAVSLLWLFGPDSSFQIFPPFLIMIFFFASYDKFLIKLLFGLVTFAVYMGMSFLYGDRIPVVEMSMGAHRCIRDSCMFIIILCTCIAAYTFASDSQSLENKLIVYNKKLKEKANTDPLTGLNNRGMAMDYLKQFVKAADEMICSICICDIDHFKHVNDTYGHDIGDVVLKNVANALRESVGDHGFVARWGGEEFFIAFPNINGDEATTVLYNVQKELKKAYAQVKDEEVRVTLTFGLTEYDRNISLEENLKDADNKLYMGKEQGRNRIVY